MKRRRGFSLVEVVLALGILVFCLVALLGLMPIGLQTFRDAMKLTVEAQIAQGLSGDLQLTDFSNVRTELQNGRTYYFDDQGMKLDAADDARRVYTAELSLVNFSGQQSPAPPWDAGALPDAELCYVRMAVSSAGRSGTNFYSVILMNNNR